MTWTEERAGAGGGAGAGDECRPRHAPHAPAGARVAATPAPRFDIFRRLQDLHDELSRDENMNATYQGLKTTSYLLEKLLARVNLNTLIVNLYPGNKGYSLSLKVNGSTQYIQPPDGNVPFSEEDTLVETARWPYEEEELLSYIDNEELPVVLLDLLESEHSCLFYSGCIIAQIRDYRQAYPSFLCDTHHVLLRPTNQSIVTDVNTMSGRCGWGGEERAALEAALVMATAPPLCLEPRAAVGLLAARLHSERRLLNTPQIRRRARRFSQVAVNRKRKLDQFTHHHGLELLELIGKQRARSGRAVAPHAARLAAKYPRKASDLLRAVEAPRAESMPLAPPTDGGAALRLARAYERPRPSQDCRPQLVEEYVLETERAAAAAPAAAGYFHVKLSVLQRPADQEFLGELYVDRDHVEGERNGAACRFSLGSRMQANKYIQQFTEIFTEEGRKSVRIKHIVPGQLPRVSFTAGMREMQQNQQIVLQQRPAAAPTQPHVTGAPAATATATGSSTLPAHTTTARSLPILQAQLQGGGGGAVSAGPGSGGSGADNPSLLKQQPSPSTLRLSPQVNEAPATQPSANQLLAQQLTNPPQPLNPAKIQPAIIQIQHPLLPTSAPQGQSIHLGSQQYTVASLASTSTPQPQKLAAAKPRTTNPAISALVTSLMNSAHQFQQQAANQNAAKTTSTTPTSNNATILNLLNSAPAAMTHPAPDSLPASLAHMDSAGTHTNKARVTMQAGHNYTRQVVGGYSCEEGGAGAGAGPAAAGEGGLLERLRGAEGADPDTGPPPTPPQVIPQQALHLQGLSLASLQGLQGIQGLQNVQVQIPGLSAPISLSLNVSGAPGGLLVSVPPTTSVVLANQPSVLSLPIAQLMSSGVKGQRGGVQLVRARTPLPLARPPPTRAVSAAPAPATSSASAPPTPLSAQFLTQSQQQTLTTHQSRRKSNPMDGAL